MYLQQQQVNIEVEGMRELRFCSNLVCEVSSGFFFVLCENYCVCLLFQFIDKYLVLIGFIMLGLFVKYFSKENYYQCKGNLEGSGV